MTHGQKKHQVLPLSQLKLHVSTQTRTVSILGVTIRGSLWSIHENDAGHDHI